MIKQPSSVPESTSGTVAVSKDAERSQAFEVLVDAVAYLAQAFGRPPTGSEVRLEMKRRTYNGFQPSRVGFKRFRDFLFAAEDEGLVQIDRERAGDVSVRLHGAQQPMPALLPHPLRADVWKAFTDWNADLARYFDLQRSRAVMLPREPAPLEPEQIAELRSRISTQSAEFVEIHPVSRQTQLDWMGEYAQSVDSKVRELLQESLSGAKPAKVFVAILRTVPGLLGEWRSFLRRRVYNEVEKWRSANSRLESVELARPETPTPAAALVAEGSDDSPPGSRERAAPRTSPPVLGSSSTDLRAARIILSHGSVSVRTSTASSLRDALHRAVDRMPESELKKINIPVGYLFEE